VLRGEIALHQRTLCVGGVGQSCGGKEELDGALIDTHRRAALRTGDIDATLRILDDIAADHVTHLHIAHLGTAEYDQGGMLLTERGEFLLHKSAHSIGQQLGKAGLTFSVLAGQRLRGVIH